MYTTIRLTVLLTACAAALSAQSRTGRYEIHEAGLQASGSYGNPYVEVRADAAITGPDGTEWRTPLFWDGGKTWKLRVSPDAPGAWKYRVTSNDAGLDGKSGSFTCVESGKAGSIVPSKRWPGHFERQNGSPFWFMGDTAWAYFTDIADEKHDRAQADAYIKTRASQGFNIIHSMMLSEGGDGNQNGPPWKSIAEEQINPAYFAEVDSRIAAANKLGVTVGIAIAWGDKRKQEPFAWRRFPSLDARKRYARYMAARFSAHDVFFLVSGEWHGEIRTRGNVSDQEVFREFVEIGNELANAEPHGRMIGIHPMTNQGSVREFTSTPWMSFADYQQNYENLHGRVIFSRRLQGPVVNSEYGYFLRDQDGDGKPDKSNSYNVEDMRFASWDIAMGGGYLVTGFGTTYFGGRRDPGPFNLTAEKNRIWEQQIGHIRKFFEQTEWWKLIPADELLSSSAVRTADVRSEGSRRDLHPPVSTYWALAEPGQTYAGYVRGVTAPVRLELGARGGKYRARQFNPRTGEWKDSGEAALKDHYEFTPPDNSDWVFLLQAIK